MAVATFEEIRQKKKVPSFKELRGGVPSFKEIRGATKAEPERAEPTGEPLDLQWTPGETPAKAHHVYMGPSGRGLASDDVVGQEVPPIGVLENLNRADLIDVLAKFPFSPYRGAKESAVVEAEKRIAEDDYEKYKTAKYEMTPMGGYTMVRPPRTKEDDVKFANDFRTKQAEEKKRGLSTLAAISRGISELPSWMLEIYIGGGISKGHNILTRALIHTTIQPHRINKTLADIKLKEPETSDAGVFAKAWGRMYFENFSELTGEYLIKGTRGLWRTLPFSKKFVGKLSNVWTKLKVGRTPKEFLDRMGTRAGYHGLLAEVGEERVNTILQSITGVDDFGAGKEAGPTERLKAGMAQDLANLHIEVAVLSVPGAAKYAAGRMLTKPEKPTIDVEDIIADIEESKRRGRAEKVEAEAREEAEITAMDEELAELGRMARPTRIAEKPAVRPAAAKTPAEGVEMPTEAKPPAAKAAKPAAIKIPENLRDMTDEQLEQSIYRMLERPLSKVEKATLTKLKRESSRRDRAAEKDTTGISRRRRTQLVTQLEKEIARSEIYKAAAEGLDAREREIGPGFYYVPKKFRSETEHVIGKVKGLPTKLQKMFTFNPEDLAKGATDFEKAVQSGLWKETEYGETVSDSYMDPGEFAQRVKDAIESRAKVGGLNVAALAQAEKSGDPYIQYKIAKSEMLRAGHSAQEIDEMTAEWAKDYELSEDVLDQEWVGEEPKKLKEIKQIKDEAEQDKQLEILARESVLRQEREEAAQNVNQVLKANDLKDAVEVEEVEEIEPELKVVQSKAYKEGRKVADEWGDKTGTAENPYKKNTKNWRRWNAGWNSYIPFERRLGRPTGATFITPAGREIVQLAYGADSETGYHEAYHVLRRRLTPKDIKILEIRFKGNQEAEAEAFANYAKTGKVQKSYLRTVWQKLRLILQRIRNALQGLGYRSINDIFGEIETGGIAKVEARPGAVRYEKGVFDQPIHEQLRLPLAKRQAVIKRIETQEKVEAKKPKAKPYEYWRPIGRVRIKSKLVKAVDAEINRTMKPRSNTVQITPEEIATKIRRKAEDRLFYEEEGKKVVRLSELFYDTDNLLPEVTEAFTQLVRGGPLFDLRYRSIKVYKTVEQARKARIKAEKERLRKVGGLARRRRAPKIRRLKIQVDAKATPALAEQWIEGAPRPPIPPPPTKTPVQGQEFSPEWYQANIKGQRTRNVFTGIAELVGEGVKGLDKAMFSSSTRLKVISPELFRRTRKYAWSVRQRFADMVDDVKPFIKATRRMSKNDWKILDLAMKNRDRRMIYELLAKYDTKHDTLAKYESVRDVLDEIYEGANEVGIDMGYLHEYWHRFVKDKKGFLKYFQQSEHWSAIMEAIKSKARRSGRKIEDITDDEKILVINSMLRGYRSSAITLSRPGAAKERIIEVIDDKLNRYYGDSREALIRYIRIMNTKIAAREFFGGETREIRRIRGNQSARLTRLAKYRKGEGLAAMADKARYKDAIKRTEEALAADGERLERLRARPLEETVGGYVFDLWQAGVIDPTKEREIVGLLKGIFDPKSAGRAMSFIKTSIYLDTLNSFIHAVTQLEELAFAFYRSPHRALPAMVRAVARKSQIRPADIGIQTVGVEFESQSMERALRTMLRVNLFTWADHLGKETLINTELNKLKRQAMSKKEKPALVRKLSKLFGKNYKEVIEDLKRTKMENLKRGDIPDRVKYLLFSEVADIHPIAETEMPEYYNRAGNLRILYTLKTFYLKRFDYLRNEAFRDMKSIKTFPRGFGKMVWMLGWFALLGAGTDWLKDFMLGRAFDLKDSIVDTLARVGLLSKYEIYAVERQKPSEFVARKLSPPMKWEDAVWRDVKSITKDKHRGFEIWRSVPFVGEFYYWWFGRGRERIEEERRATRPTRPTRPRR